MVMVKMAVLRGGRNDLLPAQGILELWAEDKRLTALTGIPRMMTSGFGRTIRIHLVRTQSFSRKLFPLQLMYRKECLSFDSDKLSHFILDSSSKICDLNANTESEVPGGQSVGVQGEAACVQIPQLDLKNVSDGDKWEEPFPAFKSWQEDSESGEAQLSPQAGRMNHHPLEEDCPPVLSHRSLDFGQSQRFLHDPETLDSSSKALSFARTRRSSFSSKDEKREDRTPYHLVKKLQKKIRQFEEQFERERNSKPSYSDIAANPKVLKWMTELTKLRKQIKDAKHKTSDGEFVPQTRPRSNTLPKSFGSSLDHEDEENEDESRVIQKEKKPSKEATLELILKRLKEKRVERCLPEDIKKMTKDHLVEEKTSLQKSLLYYESQHGRPVMSLLLKRFDFLSSRT